MTNSTRNISTAAGKRVFLGFSLTTEQTKKIEAIQLQLPANVRLVPSQNLHMTLAFLGYASNETIDALINNIDAMSKPRFTVDLDYIEHWKKPKILCFKGTASDPNLLSMATDSQTIAQKLKLHQSEYHYNPHITLSRKAKAAVDGICYTTLTIKPSALHLFESFAGKDGVEYPILHSWQLT